MTDPRKPDFILDTETVAHIRYLLENARAYVGDESADPNTQYNLLSEALDCLPCVPAKFRNF